MHIYLPLQNSLFGKIKNYCVVFHSTMQVYVYNFSLLTLSTYSINVYTYGIDGNKINVNWVLHVCCH